MNNLRKYAEYIGEKNFVKFKNVDEFSFLPCSTASTLADIGIVNCEEWYPFFTSDGTIKKNNNPTLIEIGKNEVDDILCIDLSTDHIVCIDGESNEIEIVNSSLAKYLETCYALFQYNNEIEKKEILGPYSENHQAYAKKLEELFLKVEPNILEFPCWASLLEEMEFGVI